MANDIVPFHALVDLDGVSPNPNTNAPQAIAEAQVIWAVDNTSQQKVLLYGGELHRKMRETGEPKIAGQLHIGIDQNTNELLILCDIIRAVKGPGNRG